MSENEVNRLNEILSKKSENTISIVNYLSQTDKKYINSLNFYTYFIYELSLLLNTLEMLKVFGNKDWLLFYNLVQQIKNISAINKEINSINYIFKNETNNTNAAKLIDDSEKLKIITFTILRKLCSFLVKESMKLPLRCKIGQFNISNFDDYKITETLPQNSKEYLNEIEDSLIINLANDFLNTSGEFLYLKPPAVENKKEILEFIEARISINDLKTLTSKSKDLTKYFEDTINNTLVSKYKVELLTLYRYICTIYKLIKLCDLIIHFYKKHTYLNEKYQIENYISDDNTYSSKDFEWIIVSYTFFYISYFFREGAEISKNLLHQFIQIEERIISIPIYRGFHVRPSTIISKIIKHYGTNITMVFDNEKFDAGIPFELFRANEKINRIKRNSIKELLLDYLKKNVKLDRITMSELYLNSILYLDKNKKIVINNFDIFNVTEINFDKESSHTNCITAIIDIIESLIIEGKIDIVMDIKAKFIGDQRVLRDIEILANNGYGEDCNGNNIELPKDLSYIQRDWN